MEGSRPVGPLPSNISYLRRVDFCGCASCCTADSWRWRRHIPIDPWPSRAALSPRDESESRGGSDVAETSPKGSDGAETSPSWILLFIYTHIMHVFTHVEVYLN